MRWSSGGDGADGAVWVALLSCGGERCYSLMLGVNNGWLFFGKMY